MGRRQVLASSTRSWREAIWETTTWPTPHGRTCAGGWGERRKPGPPTSGPLASRGWRPSGGSSSDGWASCRDETASAAVTIYVALLRGINVGGHKQVALGELRDLLNPLGLPEAHLLLQ